MSNNTLTNDRKTLLEIDIIYACHYQNKQPINRKILKIIKTQVRTGMQLVLIKNDNQRQWK